MTTSTFIASAQAGNEDDAAAVSDRTAAGDAWFVLLIFSG